MRQLRISKQITQRDDGSLDKYLSDISKLEMITHHEEVELAKRIRQGDKVALDRLIRANLRFVVSVAKQYQNQGLPLQDLITEGNIGLIKAAERFDETRGFKFISYAVWWIRQSILQALAEQARIVRLPLNRIANIAKVNRIISQLEQSEERDLTPNEIASEAGLTIEEVNSSLMYRAKYSSLDAPVSSGDDTVSLLDLLKDDTSDVPEKTLLYESLKKDIQRVVATLPEREGEVLKYAFGLDGKYPLSLEEIGVKMNLTKERVRQIKDKALQKLKFSEKNKVLKSYIA